jgi:[acyl-carrier-protein] S-malonyltransferase
MLADLADIQPVVEETFARASERLGYDLWRLCQDGPEEMLGRTDRTQPALLAAGVAVYRAWLAEGGATPPIMAGHSLGEYTALVCAGKMDFAEAVSLVRYRGEIMQAAVPAGSGAMAAILGLDDDTIGQVCASAADDGVVEPVNFNSPGQVVIAGEADAVDRAIERAREQGARRAIKLQVSVPSHCSLMKDAAEQLGARLDDTPIGTDGATIVPNVDANTRTTAAGIREALRQQLYRPVRWTDCVVAMQGMGADMFLEMGPGKILTGLMRRIDRRLGALAVFDTASLDKAISDTEGGTD